MSPDYEAWAHAVIMPALDRITAPAAVQEYRAVFFMPLPFWVCFRERTKFRQQSGTHRLGVVFDNRSALLMRMMHFKDGPPRWQYLVVPREQVAGQVPTLMEPQITNTEVANVEVRVIDHNTLAVVIVRNAWTSAEAIQQFIHTRWDLAVRALNLAIDRYRQLLPAELLDHGPPSYSLARHGPLAVSVEALCGQAKAESWGRWCNGMVVSVPRGATTPPFEAYDLPNSFMDVNIERTRPDIALSLLGEAFAALSGRDGRSAVVKCHSAVEVEARHCVGQLLSDALSDGIQDEDQRRAFVHRYLDRKANKELVTVELESLVGKNLSKDAPRLWAQLHQLVELRNAVVHDGASPTFEGARMACRAGRQVLTWLRQIAGELGPSLSIGTSPHDLTVQAWGFVLSVARPCGGSSGEQPSRS